jgi:hypothetical protein
VNIANIVVEEVQVRERVGDNQEQRQPDDRIAKDERRLDWIICFLHPHPYFLSDVEQSQY